MPLPLRMPQPMPLPMPTPIVMPMPLPPPRYHLIKGVELSGCPAVCRQCSEKHKWDGFSLWQYVSFLNPTCLVAHSESLVPSFEWLQLVGGCVKQGCIFAEPAFIRSHSELPPPPPPPCTPCLC